MNSLQQVLVTSVFRSTRTLPDALRTRFQCSPSSILWKAEESGDDQESAPGKDALARPVKVPKRALRPMDLVRAVLLVVNCS